MNPTQRTEAPPTLAEALDSIPLEAPIPNPLPIAHISNARHLESICEDGGLVPKHCEIFSGNRLYLSYGAPYYRPKDGHTRDPLELPVAFLFGPRALEAVQEYYPYDTGAVQKVVGEPWRSRLTPFSRYMVPSRDGSRSVVSIVRHLFGTNGAYMRGAVEPNAVNKPPPICEIGKFYAADLSIDGIDHRQSAIECHILDRRLPFAKHLIWYGIPDTMDYVFARIFRHTQPDVADRYKYPYSVNFSPKAIAHELYVVAREFVRKFVELPATPNQGSEETISSTDRKVAPPPRFDLYNEQ